MDGELADLAALREKQARGLTLRLTSASFSRASESPLSTVHLSQEHCASSIFIIANRSRQALGNLRRPDILRPFLLVTANFMFVDKILHSLFLLNPLVLFKDLTLLWHWPVFFQFCHVCRSLCHDLLWCPNIQRDRFKYSQYYNAFRNMNIWFRCRYQCSHGCHISGSDQGVWRPCCHIPDEKGLKVVLSCISYYILGEGAK